LKPKSKTNPVPRRGGWSGGPIKDDGGGPDPWLVAAVVVGVLIAAGVVVSMMLP
jgi:hypothetical protein